MTDNTFRELGREMYSWAMDLLPIARSITGPGVRSTLSYFRELMPSLTVHEVPSGTKAFDWTVPDEWFIRDAWVEDSSGQRIIDFQRSNLHVVGYSEPVDCLLDLGELQTHLHSLPDQPNAIPYVTSYYARCWGFCLTDEQRRALRPGTFRAVIDSELKPGVLNYGELIIPGESEQEVFLSTYICHPSMANNELSGPVVTTALARWLLSLAWRRYTYRIVFIPETIGSLVYLSRHLDHLKGHVIAGFNVTCIGDDRCYSYLPSRAGGTFSDRVALHVLKYIDSDFKCYTWLDRGSDERQYCSPGVDLPIASIMRSKYGEYPEYHTSLDDLSLVSPNGLAGGFNALKHALEIIEANCIPKVTVLGEPQLVKRGLYPELSTKEFNSEREKMMNLITYSDGSRDLLEIGNLTNTPVWELLPIANILAEHGLLDLKPYQYFEGKK